MADLELTQVPYSYPSLSNSGNTGGDEKTRAFGNTLVRALTQAFQLIAQKINDNFSKIETGVDGNTTAIAALQADMTAAQAAITALQNPPYFFGQPASNVNLTNNTWTVLPIGTAFQDNKSWLSSGKYIPQRAGRYRVTCTAQIAVQVTQDLEIAFVGCGFNGSPNFPLGLSWNGTSPLPGSTGVVTVGIFNFNGTTDYIQPMAFHFTPSGNTVIAVGGQSFLEVEYLGP